MRNIEMAWKEFNVDCDAILAHAKTLSDKVLASSADINFRLHCDDSITDEEIQLIQDYMDGLTAESEEAISYRSQDQIKAAIASMKAAIPAKTWASMSAVERGILIGQEPTKQQLIDAGLL